MGGRRGEGRLEIRDHWWRSHVAEVLISWGGGGFVRVELRPRETKFLLS